MQITTQDRNKLKSLHNLARVEFAPQNVPAELKLLPHWKPCHLIGDIGPNKKTTTSPKVAVGGASPFGQMSWSELQTKLQVPNQHRHFVWYLDQDSDDGYVFLDVDNLPEQFTEDDIPQTIRDLVTLCPTYVEISPSGTGLRVIYRTEKALLWPGSKKILPCKAGTDTKLYVNTCYVTMTGHRYEPMSSTKTHSIYEIEAERLASLLLASSERQVQAISPQVAAQLQQDMRGLRQPKHTLEDLTRWLFALPATLSTSKFKPIIDRTYESFTPPYTDQTDYEHWQMCAAAVAYGASVLGEVEKGATLFEQWSLNDPTPPADLDPREVGPAAKKKYYESLPKYDGNDITEYTLARLFHALKPQWPYCTMEGTGKSRKVTTSPITSNMSNWQTLFDHFDIALEQNEINRNFRFTGMDHITKQYFKGAKDYASKEAIVSDVHYFANESGFPMATGTPASQFAQRLITSTVKTYNPIKRWIDEEHDRKPYNPNEGSYFQQLWESLELPKVYRDREHLYRAYLKKNLMGIIRAHYYTGQFKHTTGMVILRGPEKCRKSSWVGLLLTQANKDYVFASQTEPTKSVVKELQIEAGTCQILLRDEVEVLMQQNDSALKNFLSQEDDAYRPLFGKLAIKVPRKCIIFGTTNQQELRISNNGSRRLMVIPVNYCDTDALLKVPMARVYLELKHEFDNTPQKDQPQLWVLNDEESGSTNLINSEENSSQSELGMGLSSALRLDIPFDIEDFCNSQGTIHRKGPRLMTHKQVKTLLEMAGESNNISLPALKHELKRALGTWTDSITQDLEYPGGWTVTQGWAVCRPKGSNKISVSGWLMPRLASEDIPVEEDLG